MNQMDTAVLNTLKITEEGLEKLLQYFYPVHSSRFPREVRPEVLVAAMKGNKIILVGETHSRDYHENEKRLLCCLDKEEDLFIGDESLEDAKDLAEHIGCKNYFQTWEKADESANKTAAEKISNLIRLYDPKIFAVVGENHVLALRSIQYNLIKSSIVPLVIVQRLDDKKEEKILQYTEYLYYIRGNFKHQ